jgi:hypothetical protein
MMVNIAELNVAHSMKTKGYTLVTQFKRDGMAFDPLYFKGRKMYEEMKEGDLKSWELVWVKTIDEFIEHLNKE